MHEEVKKVKTIVDGKETMQDKKWQYYELSPYNYMSFTEYENLVHKVGSGFRALGMNKGDRVHVFAATRFVAAELSLCGPLLMLLQPMVACDRPW